MIFPNVSCKQARKDMLASKNPSKEPHTYEDILGYTTHARAMLMQSKACEDCLSKVHGYAKLKQGKLSKQRDVKSQNIAKSQAL